LCPERFRVSDPLIDLDALLAPVPGDNPAGGRLPGEIQRKLDDARRVVDDPTRPPEDQKKADWNAVVSLASDALRNTSKDLLTAARLMEGLVKLHGFDGLHDGLRLLRGLIEQCWDRMHPDISDGDLEVRAARFNWLDDPSSGARFPSTIRMLPLVPDEDGGFKQEEYNFLNWDLMRHGQGTVAQEAFEKTIAAAPAQSCVQLAETLDSCRLELRGLLSALEGKMGPAAPGLTGVGRALEDVHFPIKEIADRKRPQLAASASAQGDEPAADGTSARPRAVTSRAEAYNQLRQAAAVLRELEPHSPVPHLIDYAVQLGEMPFPQLMKQLILNRDVLGELSRLLGIKDLAES
jgi:type VI secretion system protein ImpA